MMAILESRIACVEQMALGHVESIYALRSTCHTLLGDVGVLKDIVGHPIKANTNNPENHGADGSEVQPRHTVVEACAQTPHGRGNQLEQDNGEFADSHSMSKGMEKIHAQLDELWRHVSLLQQFSQDWNNFRDQQGANQKQQTSCVAASEQNHASTDRPENHGVIGSDVQPQHTGIDACAQIPNGRGNQQDEPHGKIDDDIGTKGHKSVLMEQGCGTPSPAVTPEAFASDPPSGSPTCIKESSHETLEHRESNYETCELRYQVSNSIWDLAWFIGMPQVGLAGSVVVSMLFALNLIMQVSFCIICRLQFTGSDFSEEAIDGLLDFRVTSAHNYLFFDTMFDKTLIQNICIQDSVYAQNLMVYGARQLEVLNAVHDYMASETDGFLKLFGGEYMCVLALACWTLCVIRQLDGTLICISALLQIPRASRTIIRSGEMIFLSPGRFLFILGIELVQVAICLSLLSFGCVWLSHTSGIQDLLLNAAALEFVLSVDEMIFDALAPRSSLALIESMAPLVIIRRISCRGIDYVSIAKALFLPLAVWFFYSVFVLPMVDQMRAAESALCGDDLDFLYGIDRSFFVWIERPAATGTEADREKRLLAAAQRSLRDIIHGRPDPATLVAGTLPYRYNPNVEIIDSVVAVDHAGYSDLLNPRCDDLISSNPQLISDPGAKAISSSYLNLLQLYTNNFSLSRCADIAANGLCTSLLAEAIVLCSTSCGCKSPLSPVFSHKSNYGCPTDCLKTPEYKTALAKLQPDCKDKSLSFLQNSVLPLWTSQVIKMQGTGSHYTSKPDMRQLAFFFQKFGCGAIGHPNISAYSQDVCDGTTPFYLRPLSPLCPQSCNCSRGRTAACPPQCLR